MNKYFKEVVTRGALDFKLSGQVTGEFGEALLGQASADYKAQFKNVCAPITLSLAGEMEEKIKILGLSKRAFITMAIQSAIEEVDEMLKDIDVTEYLREMYQESQS